MARERGLPRTSSTACRASAGAIRCCRISAWCRRRRSASTPRAFLESTAEMVRSCAASAPPVENPGVILGAILGVLPAQRARQGDDHRLAGHRRFRRLARAAARRIDRQDRQGHRPGRRRAARRRRRSTATTGSSPICGSPPTRTPSRTRRSRRSKRPGSRWCASSSRDPMQLGQEFFRWEMATAVAGSIIGINPFDQPDVEASKIKTRELTDGLRGDRQAAAGSAVLRGRRDRAVRRSAQRRRAEAAGDKPRRGAEGASRAGRGRRLRRAARLYRAQPGAYRGAAAACAGMIRDRTKVATCLGFGPRFLHSTGQAYKGGPNSGVFLQITCDDAGDLPVPGQPYTFGVVKAAQARGDFDVLAERGRRALRVHLPGDLDDRAQDAWPGAGTGLAIATDKPRERFRRGSIRGDGSMQLGMIGLGRMGGNIVRRLMRNGHSCVVYDRSADAVEGAGRAKARPPAATSPISSASSTAPKVVWVMLPAGKITHDTIVELSGLLEQGRHPDRRRQLQVPRRHRPCRIAGAKGHHLCRCRHQRRRLGAWSAAIA